jgi:hypothetical protein
LIAIGIVSPRRLAEAAAVTASSSTLIATAAKLAGGLVM